MRVLRTALSLLFLSVAGAAQPERSTEDWVVALGGPRGAEAVAALVAAGPGVLPALMAAFDDVPRASWLAVRVIGHFGASASKQTKALIRIAVDDEHSDEVRAHAALALGGIGSKARVAVGPLLEAAAERPVGRRHLAAAIAWQRIEETRPLVNSLAGEDRVLALLAASSLANMEPPSKSTKKAFLAVLDDEDAYVLYAQAVRVLEALGTGEKEIEKTRQQELRRIRGPLVDLHIFDDGAVARNVLLEMGLVTPDEPLSLPARFMDFDGGRGCHLAEFVQGLGLHLTDELARMGREVADGAYVDVGAFEEGTAGILTLAQVIEQLLESPDMAR